jgi:hypothetical protein
MTETVHTAVRSQGPSGYRPGSPSRLLPEAEA